MYPKIDKLNRGEITAKEAFKINWWLVVLLIAVCGFAYIFTHRIKEQIKVKRN